MPLLLNIDTATEYASVCLSNDGTVLGLLENASQKDHASFVQPAIASLLRQCGVALAQLDGVGATAGPGSYTGLRVGLASAKGICYTLQKPLLLVNTLEVMAQAVLSRGTGIDPDAWICPMIDARRMEVFTALYNTSLEELQAPHARVLDENSFAEELTAKTIVFSGSGHAKLEGLLRSPHAVFSGVRRSAADLCVRTEIAWSQKRFADLAYSEPMYVKEFFDTRKAQ